MSDCIQKTTQADIEGAGYVFKASGYKVDFNGFTVLYVEGKDESEDKEKELPALEKDMSVKAKEVLPNQHFTAPPPRYTEASLIKALEENGIGRPSTYAATITTITSRDYVKREGKALVPTELGEVITKLMCERFPKIVNVKFTAQMEDSLDTVENGNVKWQELIDDYYKQLEQSLKKAKTEMEGVKLTLEEDKTDLICDLCGKPMVVKYGRYGKFIACSGYPECKNIKKIVKDIGVACPKCGRKIIEKKTRKGKIFYGCEGYPECDFVSWNEPVNEKCPLCSSILFRKKDKNKTIYCAAEGCGYVKKKD